MSSTSEGKIHAAMAAAFATIRGVGKDGWNPGQKFHFRSIDDVAAAAKAALESQNVYVTPSYEVLSTTDTGKGMHILVRGEFTFHAEDGSFVTASAIGEGRDSYDKATNKAMSAAFKYALLQTFCIGDPADEGDAMSAPATPAVKQTATPKAPKPVGRSKTVEPVEAVVGPKEWGEWLAVRERVSALPETKADLAGRLKDAKIKVDRAMSEADFAALMKMAEEVVAEAPFLPADD